MPVTDLRARAAGRLPGWLLGAAGVAGAVTVRLEMRPRIRPASARGRSLALVTLAAAPVAGLPAATLFWLFVTGSVRLPLWRRGGATVPFGSAGLAWLLLVGAGRRLLARERTLAASPLNRPLVALAVTTVVSGLRGILVRDREVVVLRGHLAAQVHATALPLLSVGAALLVGNELGSPAGLRRLYEVVLGAGALHLLKLARLLPRRWRFPEWTELVLSHGLALGLASVLFGGRGPVIRLLTAGAVAVVWTRQVLLNLIRPNPRQWISGWLAMSLPGAILLAARYPRAALAGLGVAGLGLGRAAPRLAPVWAAAHAKGDFDRLVIWQDALRLAWRRPVLGVGPGNYPDHARRYFVAYAAAPTPVRAWIAGVSSAHGNYPQLAVDVGFGGLAAAAWVLAAGLGASRRLFRTGPDPFRRALAAGIGASLAGQVATGVLADTLLPSYHNGGHTKIAATIHTWALMGALIALEAGTPAPGPERIPVGALARFGLAVAGGAALLGTAEAVGARARSRRVTRRDRERDLERRLQARLARFRGDVGIYARDVTNGARYEYRAGERFAVSSVSKLFVLVHVFRRQQAGGLSLAARRRVPEAGISRQGPGVLKYLRGEPSLSVMDLCRLMTVWSDNVATDVLLQSEPAAAVNHTLATLGLTTSRVAGTCTEMVYRMAGCDPGHVSPASEREVARRLNRRELLDAGFADRSPAGTVSTPRELGRLLEGLLHGDAVGPDASARILGLLEDATTISRSMIPRFLPGDVTVVHRAGGSWRLLADAGIVDPRGRPLVLALCAHHEPGETGAADLLADVARLLFEWFRAPAYRTADA